MSVTKSYKLKTELDTISSYFQPLCCWSPHTDFATSHQALILTCRALPTATTSHQLLPRPLSPSSILLPLTPALPTAYAWPDLTDNRLQLPPPHSHSSAPFPPCTQVRIFFFNHFFFFLPRIGIRQSLIRVSGILSPTLDPSSHTSSQLTPSASC